MVSRYPSYCETSRYFEEKLAPIVERQTEEDDGPTHRRPTNARRFARRGKTTPIDEGTVHDRSRAFCAVQIASFSADRFRARGRLAGLGLRRQISDSRVAALLSCGPCSLGSVGIPLYEAPRHTGASRRA